MTYSNEARMVWQVRRAGRTAATAVLGGVLVMCILGAYLFVLKNSNTGLDQALQDGTDLLENISSRGLDSYLGRTPRRQYYLLKENGRTVGFAATVLEPKLEDDGRLFYLGRHLIYEHNGVEAGELESAFRVANDLKTFQCRKEVAGRVLEQIIYKDGKLAGQSQDLRGRWQRFTPREPGPLVCPGLEDIISSISLDQSYTRGAAFTMPMVTLVGREPHLFYQTCWVTRSDVNVPSSVKSGEGRGAKARWYEMNSLVNTRSLYYSIQHDLVWQEDDVKPVRTRELTTREALVAQLPNAERVLRQWFNTERDAPNKLETFAPVSDF